MHRHLVLSLVFVGCAGNAALEKRVADLESRPGVDPAVAGKVEKLELRLADSEKALRKQAGEIEELQKVVHDLADQLADALADMPLAGTPPPPPVKPPTAPMRGQLDQNKVYAVPLDDSPVYAGSATSPVTLVAAVQFPEPYTHKSWPVLQQLVKDYGNDLRIVVKPFIVHPQATDSTIAACAVGLQKKLDRFEDELWAARSAGGSTWPDATGARDIAKKIGVDMKLFDQHVVRVCTTGKTRDVKMFQALGQGAVPVFWINGRPLSGAQPIGSFKTIIDDEIQKAAADKGRGGQAATYYQRAVIKVGVTSGP